MTDVEYLDLEDLLRLVHLLGTGPVRDIGLLDAAAARPRSTLLGQDAYPTLELKAAALLHSLARNHSLVDGNKRIALLAVATFLDINGDPLRLSDDDVFTLVMDVAEGLSDLDDIADRLR